MSSLPPEFDECLTQIVKYLKSTRRTMNNSIVEYLINGISFLSGGVENFPSQYSFSDLNCVKENVSKWLLDVLQKCLQMNLIKKVEREVICIKSTHKFKYYLTDISLKCRTADDEMYSKYEILRNNIPRGFSLLITKNENGEDVIVNCVIYAMKKFTGTTPEDDDDDPTKLPREQQSSACDYFLRDPQKSAKVVSMEKINGEAAHISGRFVEGEYYYFAGSKNVHMGFQSYEDIDHYTDERYAMARRIAQAFLQQLEKMREFARTWLQLFFHHTRTTLVCEIKLPDHQHIVPFSTLDHDELVVIALTPPPQETVESLTALPSDSTLQFFRMLGFSVPQHDCVDYDDFKILHKKTRLARNTEGVVCYHEDHEGNTIGILKLKSSWYIHLRALRQQAAQRFAFKRSAKKMKTLEEAKKKSRRRMEELQEWLHTTSEELDAWQALSDLWIEWLEIQVESHNIEPSQIRDNFPAIFGPFSCSSLMVSHSLQRLNIDNYNFM